MLNNTILKLERYVEPEVLKPLPVSEETIAFLKMFDDYKEWVRKVYSYLL